MWLHSDQLSVEVRPEKGADITSLLDRETSIETMFIAPWGRPNLASAPRTGDSQIDWLARYGGGWQQLLPNAGPERVVEGVTQGYHGEAAIVGWEVLATSDQELRLGVELTTAPLRLERRVRLAAATLSVTDTIRNVGPRSIAISWVQHPGFGRPFIDGDCRLSCGARTVITDADIPGTGVRPDWASAFPTVPLTNDHALDLRRIPGPHTRIALFAALADFDEGWFTLTSPNAGFALRMDWDVEMFPFAWLWQECHASDGFPWEQRAYVIGIEPANVLPGEPSRACSRRGVAPRLAPTAEWVSEITVRRLPLSTGEPSDA